MCYAFQQLINKEWNIDVDLEWYADFPLQLIDITSLAGTRGRTLYEPTHPLFCKRLKNQC